MTLKGFHEAAPLVKELEKQEDLLFRANLNSLYVEFWASQNKSLPEVKHGLNMGYSSDECKMVMDAVKAAIESRIERVKKQIAAIK